MASTVAGASIWKWPVKPRSWRAAAMAERMAYTTNEHNEHNTNTQEKQTHTMATDVASTSGGSPDDLLLMMPLSYLALGSSDTLK